MKIEREIKRIIKDCGFESEITAPLRELVRGEDSTIEIPIKIVAARGKDCPKIKYALEFVEIGDLNLRRNHFYLQIWKDHVILRVQYAIHFKEKIYESESESLPIISETLDTKLVELREELKNKKKRR